VALRTHCVLHVIGKLDVRTTLRETHGFQVVHTTHAQPAFHRVGRQPEVLLPVGDESDAAEMSAGGVVADIKAITIAIKLVRIFVLLYGT
jgi:hypothetical protein